MSEAREEPDRSEPTAEVMGVGYTRQTLDQAVDRMVGWAEGREPGPPRVVAATGFHGLWVAQRDPGYRMLLNRADMLCADGIAPVLLSRWADGPPLPERVPGPDVLEGCLAEADRRGLSSFFLGDTGETLAMLRGTLSRRYPGHRVAGTLSPPFRPLDREEEREMIETINRAAPDFLWVALGTPKQERWIFRHRDSLDVPVAAAVGAAFRFLTGRTRRAPEWVGSAGFEWAWRLAMEPKRLWRRSLVQGPRFAVRALRWLLFEQGGEGAGAADHPTGREDGTR